MRMAIALALAALASGSGLAQTTAQAADPNAAKITAVEAVLQRKDYAAARPMLTELAELGNAGAALTLAQLLDGGLGGPKDEPGAVRWLTLAAERGDERAMMPLAARYREGKGGVAQSDAQAVRWYEAVVAKGMWTAHYDLGTLAYERGNYAGAAARFEKGDADPGSQACRAMMYALGQYYSKDQAAAGRLIKRAMGGGGTLRQRAYPCMSRTANAGNAEAQYQLGIMMAEGSGGAKQDLVNGLEMLNKAAAQNHDGAVVKLGELYWTGKGVARDPARAYQYNLRAADAGNNAAAYYVGMQLAKGDGVVADRARAVKYFKVADWFEDAGYQRGLVLADSDPVAAAEAMSGACYDNTAPLEWLKSAAGRGMAAAQVQYGNLLSWGSCKLTKDDAAAAKWYQKAADQGYAPGQLALGEAYLEGHGVKQDKNRGLALIRVPADRGYADAQIALGEYWLQEANIAGLANDANRVAQARQTGRGWMEKAIAQGNVRAMKSMAEKASMSGAIYVGSLNGAYSGPTAELDPQGAAILRRSPALSPDGGAAWRQGIVTSHRLYPRHCHRLPGQSGARGDRFRGRPAELHRVFERGRDQRPCLFRAGHAVRKRPRRCGRSGPRLFLLRPRECPSGQA